MSQNGAAVCGAQGAARRVGSGAGNGEDGVLEVVRICRFSASIAAFFGDETGYSWKTLYLASAGIMGHMRAGVLKPYWYNSSRGMQQCWQATVILLRPFSESFDFYFALCGRRDRGALHWDSGGSAVIGLRLEFSRDVG